MSATSDIFWVSARDLLGESTDRYRCRAKSLPGGHRWARRIIRGYGTLGPPQIVHIDEQSVVEIIASDEIFELSDFVMGPAVKEIHK